MNNCPYAGKCWRISYSRYLEDVGYDLDSPPNRFDVSLAGYAAADMLQHGRKHSIFAENFPHRMNGQAVNLCPEMAAKSHETCHEYEKERRYIQRMDRMRESREKRKEDSQRRVFISPEKRREICRKYRFTCIFCGFAHNSIRDGERVRVQVDHFIPLNRGGDPEDESNLVVACSRCNNEKKDNIWKIGCKIDKEQMQ